MLIMANEDETPNVTFEPPLYIQRDEKILSIVTSTSEISKIVDLGCGECRLLRRCKKIEKMERLIGVDCVKYLLEGNFYMLKPLNADFLLPKETQMTIKICHGNFLKADLSDLRSSHQALILSEVIEHLMEDDLPRLAHVVFSEINPYLVLITTPNADFNICFKNPNKPTKMKFRHSDHKFEWTRIEFSNWCNAIALKYSYNVEYIGVGDPPKEYPDVGYCTQIALFKKSPIDVDNNSSDKFTQCTNDKLDCLELVGEIIYPCKPVATVLTEENVKNEISYALLQEAKWLFKSDNKNVSQSGYIDEDYLYISVTSLLKYHFLKKYFENDLSLFRNFLSKIDCQLDQDEFIVIKNPMIKSNSSSEDEKEDHVISSEVPNTNTIDDNRELENWN